MRIWTHTDRHRIIVSTFYSGGLLHLPLTSQFPHDPRPLKTGQPSPVPPRNGWALKPLHQLIPFIYMLLHSFVSV